MTTVTIMTDATMSTVHTPEAAFTPDDMNLLTEISARCFQQHRWVAVARRMQSEPQRSDGLAVALANGGWPSVTIERDVAGNYSVRDPDGGVIASGPELRGVLVAWDPTLQLP